MRDGVSAAILRDSRAGSNPEVSAARIAHRTLPFDRVDFTLVLA